MNTKLNTTPQIQNDSIFTIALIAFVLWFFSTGIVVTYALLEMKWHVVFAWFCVSLIVFRTINVWYNKNSSTDHWIKNYKIQLLIKSPLEALL